MRRLSVIVAILFSLVPAFATSADPSPDYFQYFPGSPFTLGRGFIQNDLNKQFVEQCVSATAVDASPGTSGLLYSEVELSLVRDYSSLLDKVGFDARVAAHSPTSGFEASYREQRQRMEESNSLMAVVQITGEYSPVVLENAQLRSPFSELLDKGLVDDFITRCGARIVSKERRGVRLSAVITLSDVSSKSRQQIDASIGGSYGAASFTAEAKATFNKEFEKAKRNQRVDIKFKAIGGEGAEAFEQLIQASIKDVASIDGIGGALASYAKTLTKDNAGVIGYFVADMPRVAVALKDPWIQEKQSRLARLAELYRNAKDKRDAIDALVIKRDPRWVAYSPVEMVSLQKTLGSADTLIDQILKAHSICKQSGENGFMDACGVTGTVQNGVAELMTIALLGPPRVEFALAVRKGPSADKTLMGEWEWADDYAITRLLDYPSITKTVIEYSSSPKAYRDGLFYAVPKEVQDAKRAAVGVKVTSEFLESVELKFVADEGSFRPGYTEQPYVMRRFGSAELGIGKFDGPVNQSNWNRGRRTSFFMMEVDNTVAPPPPPKMCFGFLTNNRPECADYNKRYTGEIGLTIEASEQLWPWIDFPAVVTNWITNGQSMSGKGRLILVAKDRFGGETVAPVIRFEWDVDRNLHLARVMYGLGDGARAERWFIAKLGDVSKEFPKLTQKYKWTGPGNKGTDTNPFAEIHDKWQELSIKYCPSSATVIPQSNPQKTNLAARVETNRKTAAAVYTWKPSPLLPIPGKYEIDVTIRSVVKVKDTGLFDPDFYASDAGCI